MALKMTKARRNLLLIIVLAMMGTFAIRQMGKAALSKAVNIYESQAGPLTGASYAPAEVEKRSNIARWLGAGVQLIDMQTEERGFLRKLIRNSPMALDEPAFKRVEGLIERNAFPLQILFKAAPLKQSSLNLRYGDRIDVAIPNLLEYLQASLLLGAKWRIEMQRQDLSAAAETAFLQERMAAALTHEPVSIIGLIGHVAEKDFYEFLHRNINTTDESMLRLQLEYLNHLKEMATPLDRLIAADGAIVYSSLSSQFLEDQYFEPDSISSSERILMKTSYVLNRPYFLAKLLGTYTELLEYGRKPATKDTKNSIDQSWVARIFFSSNLDTIVRRYQAQDAARNLALAVITMRLNGVREGGYKKPASLPKSMYTGETAKYLVLPDGAVEVSFPETINMWDQKFAKGPPERPRLIWKLPAL